MAQSTATSNLLLCPPENRWKPNHFHRTARPKLAVENYLRAYGHLYDLNYTIVRPANVYGPRQNPHGEAGVIAIFTQAMLEGRQITIFGDGNDQRDYIYIDDFVEGVLALADSDLTDPYNIGTGYGVSVNEIHHVLSELIRTAKTSRTRTTQSRRYSENLARRHRSQKRPRLASQNIISRWHLANSRLVQAGSHLMSRSMLRAGIVAATCVLVLVLGCSDTEPTSTVNVVPTATSMPTSAPTAVEEIAAPTATTAPEPTATPKPIEPTATVSAPTVTPDPSKTQPPTVTSIEPTQTLEPTATPITPTATATPEVPTPVPATSTPVPRPQITASPVLTGPVFVEPFPVSGQRGGEIKVAVPQSPPHQDIHKSVSPILAAWGPGIAYSLAFSDIDGYPPANRIVVSTI